MCVWDVDQCMQLQRLDHGRDERGVIALAFSGDHVDGKGGDLLLTVRGRGRERAGRRELGVGELWRDGRFGFIASGRRGVGCMRFARNACVPLLPGWGQH